MVVEQLVPFLNDEGFRVASRERGEESEKNNVFQNLRAVFGKEEWIEVPGLKLRIGFTVEIFSYSGNIK